MDATKTTGQQLTNELRRYFRIGTRTRRYRRQGTAGSTDLHEALIEAIETNNRYPGFYNATLTAALRPAYGVALAWRKHVGGHRIDPLLRLHLGRMSTYQFAALLGRMVDAGVTNTGEGELFFAQMARENR